MFNCSTHFNTQAMRGCKSVFFSLLHNTRWATAVWAMFVFPEERILEGKMKAQKCLKHSWRCAARSACQGEQGQTVQENNRIFEADPILAACGSSTRSEDPIKPPRTCYNPFQMHQHLFQTQTTLKSRNDSQQQGNVTPPAAGASSTGWGVIVNTMGLNTNTASLTQQLS